MRAASCGAPARGASSDEFIELLGSAIDHSVARSRKIDRERSFRKPSVAAGTGVRQFELLALDEALLVLFDADGLADDLLVDAPLFFTVDAELDFLDACAFPLRLE